MSQDVVGVATRALRPCKLDHRSAQEHEVEPLSHPETGTVSPLRRASRSRNNDTLNFDERHRNRLLLSITQTLAVPSRNTDPQLPGIAPVLRGNSMAKYEDDLSPRESESLDDVEMQERDTGVEGQKERLLSGEDIESGGGMETAYRTEWQLRTGWAIVFSITAVGTLFLLMLFLTKTFIVGGSGEALIESLPEDFEAEGGIGGFRRPASDYILAPTWDYSAPKTVRTYRWTITDRIVNPDGVFRPMITINGQFPGPLIECNEGDTLVIELDNQSVNATALHFHGIFQNGTNFMDGTTGMTQCPIAPGRKFRYEFIITGQSGTYYYHGHQAVQISDGLYGPLVIHSKHENKLQKIPYATDRVVMLQDYYHDLSSGLLKSSLEPGSEASPIPNGILVNGYNSRDCSSLPHRMCDNSTASVPSFDLPVNENHRLRFINVGAFAWFQVELDEHKFAITEVDGTDVEPAWNTRMMISPAQRYSIVVRTDQAGKLFWLRARMVAHCWKNPLLPGPGADEVKSVVKYTSGLQHPLEAIAAQPQSRSWPQGMEVQCKDMNNTNFIPVLQEPAPQVADHSYYLRSNLEIGDWRLERGFFNQSTFRPNLQQPTLHRTIEGLRSGNSTFSASQMTDGVNSVAYDIKNDFLIQHSGIKVVDLVIQNFDEGNHPMHLHGHKFWVVGQGHGMFPGYEQLGLKPEGRGVLDGHENALNNLVRRDVATAEGFGWLVLRFIADNPGVWAFHCHMAWHSEAGLVMQFLDRVDEVATWEIPEANRQLCEENIKNLEKGAIPPDSTWFGFGIGG